MKPLGSRQSGSRRPLLLWLLILWLLALSATGFWRAATLWQARDLLVELGSTLSAPTVILFVALYLLFGTGLLASTLGLWQKRDWGRRVARVSMVCYLSLVQAYTWLFVRTGLLWQHRWTALFLALVAIGVSVGALTWPRSRQWLGLG